jgi:hypothetical protein
MTFGQGLNNFATDSEAVRINIAARIRVILGEWFMDMTIGVPYFQNPNLPAQQNITDKPVDLSFAEATLKAIILQTEDVIELISFNMVYNPQTRQLSITGTYYDAYSPEVQSLEVAQ